MIVKRKFKPVMLITRKKKETILFSHSSSSARKRVELMQSNSERIEGIGVKDEGDQVKSIKIFC